MAGPFGGGGGGGGLPFGALISLGRVVGVSDACKFGQNPDVDMGAEEDIWQTGGTWVAPGSAAVVSVASGSANDAAAGTGVRTLTIQGLDSSWAEASETVTLNGTGAVTTSGTFLRVNRAFGATFGSAATNSGDITLTIGGVTQATILAGWGQTQKAIFTVPTGKSMIIEQYSGSLVRTVGDGEVRLYARLAVDTATSGWRVRHAQGASGTPHHFDGAPLHIPGPADVRLAAISTVNNAIVIGSWEGYLL